jgi:plastocyanin
VSWRKARKFRRLVSTLGAGLLLFLPLVVGGCGERFPEATDPEIEGARAMGLPSGSRLHQVLLGGRGSEEHVLPQRVSASPGDAVEFVTVDHRVHTISFLPDSLSSEALAFLTEEGRVASLPLISRGSRFLVILEGAPAGRYPFVSQGHGGKAYGVIDLRPPQDPVTPGRN